MTSSVLPVLVAGGWWWVTWPERTARNFLDLLAALKYEDARERFGWTPAWQNQSFLLFARESKVQEATFRSEPRSLSDVIAGRQSFTYGRSLVFRFTVMRGKVVASGYYPNRVSVKKGKVQGSIRSNERAKMNEPFLSAAR